MEECGQQTFDQVFLVAVKSLNDTTWTEIIVPTLLVFCTIPQIGINTYSTHPDIAPQAMALARERREMTK